MSIHNLSHHSECENVTLSMSAKVDAETMEHIGYVYIIPVICSIGFILNIFNLTVLCGPYLKGSSYTYLTALAVADGLTCLIVFPIGFVRCSNCLEETTTANLRVFYEIYIYLPLANVTATCSAWITVALSMDRYILTRFPIKGKKLCRIDIARKLIAIIVIIAIGTNISYFLQSHIVNGMKEPTELSLTKGFHAYAWIRATFTKFFPIIFLIALNVMLINAVHKLERRRKSMVMQQTSQMKKQYIQNRLTVMLIAVIFVFLIGSIPITFAHSAIFTAMFGSCSTYTVPYLTYRLIANILEMLNYTCNFVLYCLLNKKFQKRLCKLFGCSQGKKIQDVDMDLRSLSRSPTGSPGSQYRQCSNQIL